MSLPPWAESAFNSCRPKPPHGARTQQSDWIATQRWQGCLDRFDRRWQELETEKWRVGRSASVDRTEILTAAIECARRVASGIDDPRKIIEKRRRLLQVDQKISELAATLVELFEERQELENSHGVATWCSVMPDAIDLWHAVEVAFKPRPGDEYSFAGSMAPVGDDLDRIVRQVQTTSLRVPQWIDVLQLLADRFEGGTSAGDFPDITSQVGNTNRTKFSPWCGALIQMLHGRGVLGCLNDDQLASLASVAFEPDYSGAINAKQIGSLRRSEIDRLS